MTVLVRLLLVIAYLPFLSAAASVSEPGGRLAPRYALTVDLRPADGRVLVQGEVRVPASAADRSELVFSVNGAFRGVWFDVASPHVGPLAVSENGGFTDYSLRPARPFPAARDIVVRFSYQFEPDTPVSYFYAGDDGAFASGVNVAWYPQLSGRPPHGVGRVRFLLPRHREVVVNGRQGARSRVRSGPQASFSFSTPTAFRSQPDAFTNTPGPTAHRCVSRSLARARTDRIMRATSSA